MSYTFERFGAITLPTYNRESSIAPAAAAQRIVATTAGAFDADGSGRSAQQFPHSLTVEAIVSEDDAADQRDALDELRAAVGTRAYLYRRADNDSAVHRAPCRLASMTQDRSYEQRRAYQPVRLQFVQLGPWQGTATAWTFDDGESFDDGLAFDASTFSYTFGTSPMTRTREPSGNLPVVDVLFTITAPGGASLSNVVLTGGGMDLRWTGTIPAGQALTIDSGAAAVLLAGADAYDLFAIGDNHAIEGWCNLEPGDTSVTLQLSGTVSGAVWSVDFRERWA